MISLRSGNKKISNYQKPLLLLFVAQQIVFTEVIFTVSNTILKCLVAKPHIKCVQVRFTSK